MNRSLSILLVPGHTIYPANSGGAHNQLALLTALQHMHRLTVVITPDNVSETNIPKLEKLLNNVTFIRLGYEKQSRLEKTKQFLLKQRRKLSGRDSAYKLWKNSSINNFLIKESSLVWQIAEVIKQQQADIIQIDHTKNLALVAILPESRKVVYVHHELYFTRVYQELLMLHYTDTYVTYITNVVKAIELYYLSKCDGVVTFNEDDQHVLQQAGLAVPMKVSKPFCLLEKITNIYDAARTPGLIFIGGEGHYPNKEGFAWFLEEVYPLLPDKYKQTPVKVTGEWSEAFRQKYADRPVQFLGFVHDLDNVLQDSVLIAPIRIGSGVRIKICTSMAKGLPVISTVLGASGISGLIHGENIMLADTPQDFVLAIEQVLDNQDLRKKLSQNVWTLAAKIFDGNEFVQTRAAFLEEIAISA